MAWAGLSTNMHPKHRALLEAWGCKFAESSQLEPLYTMVQLPPGWKMRDEAHEWAHTIVEDNKGRARIYVVNEDTPITLLQPRYTMCYDVVEGVTRVRFQDRQEGVFLFELYWHPTTPWEEFKKVFDEELEKLCGAPYTDPARWAT